MNNSRFKVGQEVVCIFGDNRSKKFKIELVLKNGYSCKLIGVNDNKYYTYNDNHLDTPTKIKNLDFTIGRTMPIAPHEMPKVKWSDLFENENELINSLKQIDIDTYTKHYQGYENIKSFALRVITGQELTPKQITQLKRISKEIYRYFWNAKYTPNKH